MKPDTLLATAVLFTLLLAAAPFPAGDAGPAHLMRLALAALRLVGAWLLLVARATSGAGVLSAMAGTARIGLARRARSPHAWNVRAPVVLARDVSGADWQRDEAWLAGICPNQRITCQNTPPSCPAAASEEVAGPAFRRH